MLTCTGLGLLIPVDAPIRSSDAAAPSSSTPTERS